MDKKERIEFILKEKLLFIIRTDDLESAMRCFDALVEGGAKVIEFTSTIPNYDLAIKKAKEVILNDGILIGAGTVLDKTLAIKAMEGDPDFIVNPIQNFEIFDVIPNDRVVFLGGFTPTEIILSYKRGADFVKIFPASVLGPKFIRAIKKGPLPFVKILASGGMDIELINDYIMEGVDVIGVGSEVVSRELIKEKNFSKICTLTKEYISKVKGI
ncbi:MAG: bifunctional 4-hydroxy-2-oxoglutarate aldolase/2-dehydro-3-deoxy-phosphogluconate aldolase [Brevinematia bacterium]